MQDWVRVVAFFSVGLILVAILVGTLAPLG
jgi:hypothetical protein